MENDNKDFLVPPGCDPVPLSAHRTNPYHVMLGGTTSCIDKTSTNFPPSKSVSGITQTEKGYSVQGDRHCVTISHWNVAVINPVLVLPCQVSNRI